MSKRVKPKLKLFLGSSSWLLKFIQWLIRWLSKSDRIALREKLKREVRPDIDRFQADWEVVDGVLKKLVGDIQRFLVDSTYWLTDLDGMKKVIEFDWTDKYRYIAEARDCDDFAWYFKSHLSEWHDLTAVAWVWGAVYEGKTFLGLHAWNVIIVKEGDDLKAYHYEPQLDQYSETGEFDEDGLRYEAMGLIA